MHYQSRIFSSRISKRIFTTFVVCALIPVLCLAALVYLQVTRHIREETAASLRHAAKSQAKILTDQLIACEKELELVGTLAASVAPRSSFVLPDHLIDRLSNTFASVCMFASVDRPHALLGRPPIDYLQLRPDDLRHLAKGETLLLEMWRGQSRPLLILVRRIAGTGRGDYLAGQIDMDRFWQTDVLDNLPLDTGFCVFGFSGNRLFPPTSRSVGLIDAIRTDMHAAISGHFEVDTPTGNYFASHTQLFLKPAFKLPHWDVVLYQSTADVFAPVDDFTISFPLVLVLAFIVVIWLSLVNIKRNLVPIDALKAGVDRIADNHFSHRVEVGSGDELEELADAFNRMSGQLRIKFSELHLIASLGTRITTILDVDDLARAVIESIRHNLDVSGGAILLARGDARQAAVHAHFGFHPDAIRQMRNLDLHPDTAPRNPIAKAFADQIPVWLTGEAETADLNLAPGSGPQAVVCVPLVYEGQSLGVLVLARAVGTGGDIRPSDTAVLAGIAAQTAVSLVNIDAFRKIRESEQRFRAAFDYSAGGIVFIAPTGDLLRCNAFFCRMLGYATDELLARTYSEIVHPTDLARSLASLKRMLQGPADADSFESRYLHKDGSTVWGFVSTSLLRDAAGEPMYFISLIQDLTAAKAAQREKQTLESQLQQSQKMEAIGTLAGGIAHDFNNILMAIYGYTQISLMKAHDSGDDEITGYLDKIMAASERAKALVGQILTFSRRGTSEFTSMDLNPVIKETIKLLRATIPPTIDIQQDLPASPPMVMADPNQIHQIVMNLCTNAYHAVMEKGTGSIRVTLVVEDSLPDGMVTGDENESGRLETVSSCLKLSIADSGCGMDAETRGKIFDPYYTTKAEGKGTGLGLSVVHGIVKNHDGVITVSSAPGEGTTFDVFLPITDADAAPVSDTPGPLPTGSERILVVDDEPDVIAIFERMLSGLGYAAVCTPSPVDALNEFNANADKYALVITDMAMPKIMGSDLALRMKGVNPDIRIICCSGHSELIDTDASDTLFDAFLPKPFSHETLATTVRRTIDH